MSFYKKIHCLFFSVILAAGLLSNISHATCKNVSIQYSHGSFGNIVVQRDIAVGEEIAKISLPSTGAYGLDCDGSSTFGLLMNYSSQLSSLGNNIYKTNIPGVGIRIYNGGVNASTFNDPHDIIVDNTDINSWNWQGGTVVLYKTGPISSGMLSGGLAGTIELLGYDGKYHDGAYIQMNSGTVTALACSMYSISISVPFGNIDSKKFTGVGATSVSRDFTLGMNCDADANVHVKLTGQQSPDTSDNSVVALSGDNAASGLGVQFLYNNTPLKLNELLPLKKSNGGEETFSFAARYYQTKGTVTPGNANAVATFEITYQ